MNLEQQVCKLGLSVKLQKLGVKQESLFWWHYVNGVYVVEYKAFVEGDISLKSRGFEPQVKYSAFTVAELGLPFSIQRHLPESFKYNTEPEAVHLSLQQYPPFRGQPFYEIGYFSGTGSILDYLEKADTEANVRAQMKIWLIENKYLEVIE